MKVLVTGFQPFGEETINPALEAVEALPSEIAGVEIIKAEIPVVFATAGEALEKATTKLSRILFFALARPVENQLFL